MLVEGGREVRQITGRCTTTDMESGLDWCSTKVRVVHLDVEEWSEELLRQLSYAIKNQLVASKAPY